GKRLELLEKAGQKMTKYDSEDQGETERGDNDDDRINHQALEPDPEGVGALIMVSEQVEHPREVVAARANLDHAAVKDGQVAAGEGLGQGGAASEIFREGLDLRSQRLGIKTGTELLQRAFERNIFA